ncbi:MAG: AAA family ATPase, partial [Bacteroidales bacterium]|nr:AAA family ATPase [Bacteroidales bacterium]
YIRPSELSYEEWCNVGMALKQEGYTCDVWDEWSRPDSRWEEGACQRKWNTFNGSDKPVTGGTIIQMARLRGWEYFDLDGCMDWDDPIEDDGDGTTVREIYNPTEDLIKYLQALFQPDEYVGYVVKADEKKLTPGDSGVYTRTAQQLIDSLRKSPNIDNTIGTYNEEAGAWIRFNPLDGKGIKDENVAAFRYTLVESDTLDIEEQKSTYEKMKLPIAAMVHSGGKSVHAIVRINAENEQEYQSRVNYLHKYLLENGFELDKQDKNPSRLSRMPGVTRSGRKQRLIAVNVGSETWEDWVDFVEGNELPPIEDLADYRDNLPELRPELIEGILRVGHKMLISGPSKAGKSMLLMNLCICIAEGLSWLGHQCRQGRVLYINLEIDKASTINRFYEVYEKMGYDRKNFPEDRLKVWSLRGQAMPLDKLVPKMIKAVGELKLDAVVLDPIYKVITGDENSATDMGMFCNQFDRICKAFNCSAIYCHHHSKGAQGNKKAMDRASGSGVFARDPDAQLDMAPLVLSSDAMNNARDGFATGWRIESSLREFRNIQPINVWFCYPMHEIDTTGVLEKCLLEGEHRSAAVPDDDEEKPAKLTDEQKLVEAYSLVEKDEDGGVAISKLAEVTNNPQKDEPYSEKTIERWVKKSDSFQKLNNRVIPMVTADNNWSND